MKHKAEAKQQSLNTAQQLAEKVKTEKAAAYKKPSIKAQK